MSGHSKWSTIKHQKGVADKRRGQLFSKLAKAITIAAKEGDDPDKNFKLRLAVDRANKANMPKPNIERAISRGCGKTEAEGLEAVVYEGYGPYRVAVVAEAVTDNRNRTTSEIKKIFERSGGSLGGPGSVVFQFKKTGLIIIKKPENIEEAILTIIDLGVENVEETRRGVEVYTRPAELEKVSQKILKANLTILSKDLVMQPQTLAEIKTSAQKEKVIRFLETLDAHEDIQKVFANFNPAG